MLVCQGFLALCLALVLRAKGYLLYWLLPYLTTFKALTWFIELAEHFPMIAKAKVDFQVTRNRLSHPLEHYFTAMHGSELPPDPPSLFCHSVLELQEGLQDPAYATMNAGVGGIFVSSNFAPSMWGGILSNDKSPTGIVINAIYFQQRRHVCTLRRGTERNDRCTQ
ncbi:hypothetical protein [Pseudomonas frederiksbergensis]|uniref:hypothetical protein n=1 Tax=Pseudomonas frederiksbergensis TaxID=104087 RepID=UPI0021820F2C|nr:hypothetical protein [Pseudomonas frederiksbergensis]